MADLQLKLFTLPKTLEGRIGTEFFKSLPKTPGVYRMFDSTNRIIYIGQSKNLRQRLFSYKNASSDRTSRKVRRLISCIRRIEFEECPSPLEAQLRENELLRQHRPKFNSLNVYPAAYIFIMMEPMDGSVACRWTRETGSVRPGEQLYGSFKGMASRACAALARLMDGASHRIDCPTRISRRLLLARPAKEFLLPTRNFPVDQPTILGQLDGFFSGETPALLETLRVAQPPATSAFHQSFVATDLELLADFFRIGPRRNWEIQSRFGLERALIQQEQLDDWIVRERLTMGPSLNAINGHLEV